MKILVAVMVLLAAIYFLPAFMMRTDEINGVSQKVAFRTAREIKRHLSTNERVLFDTAFGILAKIKGKEGEKAFLETVDGKGADEIIELARQEVNARIAAGDPEFKPYASWDDMMEKMMQDVDRKSHKVPAGQAEPPLRNSVRTGRPD